MNCQDCEHLIEHFFQKALMKEEIHHINQHLEECQKCNQLYRDYEQLENVLHSLPPVKCPEDVIQAVIQEINQSARGNWGVSLMNLVTFFKHQSRLAIASGLVIFSVLFFLLTMTVYQHINPVESYSKEELLAANNDVKHTLAKINSISRKISRIVTHDVVFDGVVMPVQSSMMQALEPLTNGENS